MFSQKVRVSSLDLADSGSSGHMVHANNMSFVRKRGGGGGGANAPRQLGSMRKSVNGGGFEGVPKFPPLISSPTATMTPVLDKSYKGIAGNAMQVPDLRQTPEQRSVATDNHRSSPSRKTPPRKSYSSKSVDSGASSSHGNNNNNNPRSEGNAKELKESMLRERELKQTIMQLQKVIDDLRMQVKDKEKVIEDLQKQFARQEEKYKELYETEKSRHAETQADLTQTRVALETETKQVAEWKKRHDTETRELKLLMELRLRELREEKDKEISIRDEKLNKLKKQMADALKGNSWERQQQLDELTKELGRVQDEADGLRFRIKALQKAKGGACGNCDATQSQLSASKKAMQDRDSQIKELKELCSKFEKQLNQQDKLLRQKGIKVS